MGLITDYQKIRKISLMAKILKENTGKFIRIRLIDNHKFYVKVLTVCDTYCLLEFINQGLNSHPVISCPIGKIKKITSFS